MKNANYSVFKYTVQPLETIEINHSANSLTCLAATDRFKIGFDGNPLTTFESGLSYTADANFSKVRIHNNTGAAITVELGFASGGIRDARLVLTNTISATVSGQVGLQGGDTINQSAVNAVTPTAQTAVMAANANRNEIMITNLGAETVFVGGAGVLADTGLPITAGSTAVLTTVAALFVAPLPAANVKLAVMEVSQ